MDDARNVCEAGFTDPLLAKQKQHSKKAFELIGKALRLDEENKHGMYDTILFVWNCMHLLACLCMP